MNRPEIDFTAAAVVAIVAAVAASQVKIEPVDNTSPQSTDTCMQQATESLASAPTTENVVTAAASPEAKAAAEQYTACIAAGHQTPNGIIITWNNQDYSLSLK